MTLTRFRKKLLVLLVAILIIGSLAWVASQLPKLAEVAEGIENRYIPESHQTTQTLNTQPRSPSGDRGFFILEAFTDVFCKGFLTCQ